MLHIAGIVAKIFFVAFEHKRLQRIARDKFWKKTQCSCFGKASRQKTEPASSAKRGTSNFLNYLLLAINKFKSVNFKLNLSLR